MIVTKLSPEEMNNPWTKCLCGGFYCLYYDDQDRPTLSHSLPFCDRFVKIVTVGEAVNFSRANRGVS